MTAVRTDFELGRDSVTPALRKLQGEVDKLTKANQKLADTSKRSSQAGNAGLTKLARSAATAALGYVSLSKAIQLVNAEIEKQNRLQTKAKDTGVTAAKAQSALVKNIGDITDRRFDKFQRQLGTIQKSAELGSIVPVTAAAASVLSAVSGTSAEKADKAIAILRETAPFFRQDPEGLATFGGALGDVSKSLGVSPKRGLGFTLALQQQARFVDPGKIKEFAQALASSDASRSKGVDRLEFGRQVAGIFAGAGGRAGDVEAGVTKTAVANLITNLARETPGGLPFEQLRRVQQDPELFERVFQSGFKGSIKPVFQELGSGGEAFTASLTAFQQITADEASVDRRRARLRRGTPQLELSGEVEALKGVKENFLLVDKQAAARAASARKGLTDLLDESRSAFGAGFILRGLDFAASRVGDVEDREIFINAIRGEREDIATKRRGTPENRALIRLADEQLRVLNNIDNKTPPARVVVDTTGDE